VYGKPVGNAIRENLYFVPLIYVYLDTIRRYLVANGFAFTALDNFLPLFSVTF
jgi:hypothetical protein